MSISKEESEIILAVENIGGIDETHVTFEPGVTVLAGRNATNRTSLLQAIMAALGSENVSIKADAEQAKVELTIEGQTYTRTLERQSQGVRSGGDPYLSETTLADLFAFLLESNEARRAVVTDADLRELIMRPVNTADIQSQIDELLQEKRDISKEIEELSDLKRKLPKLEEKRTQLKKEIKETRSDLEEVEDEIEKRDEDVGETRDGKEEVDAKLEELQETRSELQNVRYDLETETESLESLQAEKQEIGAALEQLSVAPDGSVSELESRIDQLRTKKQQLESELSEVQSVIGFNEERLEDEGDTFTDLSAEGSDSGSVTDELLPDSTVTCWTCGSQVETDQIETTIDKLRELSQSLFGEIDAAADELTELIDEKQELAENKRRRKELERKRGTIKTKLTNTQERIEELKTRRDALQDEVETTEQEVERLESDVHDEVIEIHKQANQLEYDLGKLEGDLERVEDNIGSVESQLNREENLNSEREALTDEIETLRTRIERIEQEAIAEFNENMETVLDLLEYENLSRVWLERRETKVREGRRKVTKSVFDLNIVRQTDTGTTYQDTIENLSESEREVTGLIFALSGYLAHEVYETVPFLLLDSLEAIDSDRIAKLIEYVEDLSGHLVVALLPEDAAALPDRYREVTDI